MLLLGLTWVRFCLCCWLRFAWAPIRRTRTTMTTRLLPTPRPRRSSHQPPSESRAVVEQSRVSNALAEKHRDWSEELAARLTHQTRVSCPLSLLSALLFLVRSLPSHSPSLPFPCRPIPSRPVALRFSHFSVVLAVKGCSFDCSAASFLSRECSIGAAGAARACFHARFTHICFLLERCT